MVCHQSGTSLWPPSADGTFGLGNGGAPIGGMSSTVSLLIADWPSAFKWFTALAYSKSEHWPAPCTAPAAAPMRSEANGSYLVAHPCAPGSVPAIPAEPPSVLARAVIADVAEVRTLVKTQAPPNNTSGSTSCVTATYRG